MNIACCAVGDRSQDNPLDMTGLMESWDPSPWLPADAATPHSPNITAYITTHIPIYVKGVTKQALASCLVTRVTARIGILWPSFTHLARNRAHLCYQTFITSNHTQSFNFSWFHVYCENIWENLPCYNRIALYWDGALLCRQLCKIE